LLFRKSVKITFTRYQHF